MSLKFKLLPAVLSILLFSVSCDTDEGNSRQLSPEFKEYWFSGTAEVSSYDLKQSRYGEERDGHAALIFVTEPFSEEKQVKLDNPGADGVTIMKLNFVRKFITGIYPYSTMMSTFSPLETSGASCILKETFSAQEWCGQVFTQLNKRNGRFDIHSYSYFEQEGDRVYSVDEVLTEDELWTLIKINPAELPEGNIQIMPGITASRLKHFDFEPVDAVAALIPTDTLHTYTITYPDGRELRISYTPEFPHSIEKWEEVAGNSVTTAVRMKTFKIPYWQMNKNRDQIWRDSLHLN